MPPVDSFLIQSVRIKTNSISYAKHLITAVVSDRPSRSKRTMSKGIPNQPSNLICRTNALYSMIFWIPKTGDDNISYLCRQQERCGLQEKVRRTIGIDFCNRDVLVAHGMLSVRPNNRQVARLAMIGGCEANRCS